VHVGVVLVREPRIRIAGNELEIAVLAQPPEDVSGSLPVAIIDLDDPILVSRRVKNTAIGSQLQTVSVSPVVGLRSQEDGRTAAIYGGAGFVQGGEPVRIQMIERVP